MHIIPHLVAATTTTYDVLRLRSWRHRVVDDRRETVDSNSTGSLQVRQDSSKLSRGSRIDRIGVQLSRGSAPPMNLNWQLEQRRPWRLVSNT